MNIVESSHGYENWLRSETSVIEADLALKHERMAGDPYTFMRGTFFRWMQLWQENFGGDNKAPVILSVGDLHASNFGTWRDAQSRLIWGINDFDEAYPLPYTLDLTRLAVSIRLANAIHVLKMHPDDACKAIMEGYCDCLDAGGKPFVIKKEIKWLQKAFVAGKASKDQFWSRMESLPDQVDEPPAEALAILKAALPAENIQYRIKHRQAGIGSLGRPRFTILGIWQDQRFAREVKYLVPSAASREIGGTMEKGILYSRILADAVRCRDPIAIVHDRWILRKLAPDNRRIELDDLGQGNDEERLIYAMGWETGNIHLGNSHSIMSIREDLQKRKKDWLVDRSKHMARITWDDWNDWKKGGSL